MKERNLNDLVDKAVNGDSKSFTELIKSIQDKIYNLSIRMLWNPHDAQDATQEILLKIVTNLSSFRKECRFSTWSYKIAVNYLLTLRKKNAMEKNISFDQFHDELSHFKSDISYESNVEQNVLIQELKVSCTHAILLCLERDYRVIFILDVIFKINSTDGAYIMGITPAAFRKRLSRSKKKIADFMKNNCGLMNPENNCNCKKRLNTALVNKRIHPDNLLFANRDSIDNSLREMEKLDKLSSVFLSNPYYRLPREILNDVMNIINSRKFGILNN